MQSLLTALRIDWITSGGEIKKFYTTGSLSRPEPETAVFNLSEKYIFRVFLNIVFN
jgi:hypothetical protein